MSKCNQCIYYCERTTSCDYYLITGERRGCSVENCEKYEKLLCKRRPPSPVVSPAKPKEEKPKVWKPRKPRECAKNEAIKRLYYQGKTDQQIAAETGYCARNIWYWRHRRGLPSHSKIGRPKKEEHNERD